MNDGSSEITADAFPQGVNPSRVNLSAPFSPTDMPSLALGQEVWLTGSIWGVRDATLIRMFDTGEIPDVDFTGAVFLHTAPSVIEVSPGQYQPVSIGTTTSMRMDRFTEACLGLGVRAIIGKGGLSQTSAEALARHGAIYLAIVGGAASYETTQVEAIEEAYFPDLMPECLWRLRVRELGPLFVAIDGTGRSSYEQVAADAGRNLADIFQRLGI